MQLRRFQSELKHGLFQSWDGGHQNSILVSPTGSGKTVTMGSIAKDVNDWSCAIAHRQELVQQISLAMARFDIPHNIVAPDAVVRVIVQKHVQECGMSYLNRNGMLTVAGVNTLNARAKELGGWASKIRYWMGDECHHFLEANQWGKAVAMFKGAKGVGFTATPVRCDRKSLARTQGGVFDDMIVGPSMRELITMGFLSDYKVYAPPISINRDNLKISKSTGDVTAPSMKAEANSSTLYGDIVTHYLRLAHGKRGITFVHDVEAADKVAAAYNDAGVPAASVNAKTPDLVRNSLIDEFRAGKLMQLVNVDLFGEGFDVPAVEVVSMARATMSFGLYVQQFGRALRLADNKTHGIIIDHVGNVHQHGLPDAVVGWQLEVEGRNGSAIQRDPNAMPTTSCTNCFETYERVSQRCPFCGHVEEPASRSDPKHVDGDLIELTAEALDALRAQAAAVNAPFDARTDVPGHLRGTPAEGRIKRQYQERRAAHDQLARSIAEWAGVRRHGGMADSEIYRRFYVKFGVDVLGAQSIKELAKVQALAAAVAADYWAV